MKNTILAAAIVALLILPLALASPEKVDKFGCHRCLTDCEEYGLVKSEYHCHGTPSVQSQSIQIAPRIIDGKTYRRVASIIDGDTIHTYYGVGGKKEKIRILGIDAPEAGTKSECYSKQATYELKKLLLNKHVLLGKDKIQKDDRDKYGRLLRYVMIDNQSAGEEMLRKGAAKAYPSLTANVEKYKKLENDARAAKAGLWAECFRPKQNGTITRLFPLKGQ